MISYFLAWDFPSSFLLLIQEVPCVLLSAHVWSLMSRVTKGDFSVVPDNDNDGDVVVPSLSRVWLSATPWTAAQQASLSITVSQSLLKLIHWVSDVIQPSHPLLFPSPTAFNLSQNQGLFQRVSSSHQVAKVLEL